MHGAITIKRADMPYSLTPRNSKETADGFFFWGGGDLMGFQVRILHKTWQDVVLIIGRMWDEIVICEEVLPQHSVRKSRKVTQLVTVLPGSANGFHSALYL